MESEHGVSSHDTQSRDESFRREYAPDPSGTQRPGYTCGARSTIAKGHLELTGFVTTSRFAAKDGPERRFRGQMNLGFWLTQGRRDTSGVGNDPDGRTASF